MNDERPDRSTSEPQQPRGVFVGRTRELDQLVHGLDDAAGGRGRLFLLAGEPGIGKSRLADELTAAARDRGYHALWGRGWEDAGAPPYWPWVQALRSLLRRADPAPLRQDLGTGAAEVAQMLPELHGVLGELPTPPPADPESARFRLFDSTTAFLHRTAARQPLLLVLDDLQAADTPSVLLLRFLAGQLGDARILVVATYRDVELGPEHRLTAAIGELAREPSTTTLHLGGLGETAVGQLIAATVGVEPNAELVSVMWRETDGNPLFLGEAVRLLDAEGRLSDAARYPSLRLAVPAGVREVITRRIGHLDERISGMLTLSAVIGPEFSVEIVRRAGDYGAEEVIDLIDEALAAGLLAPVTGSIGRYRFSHDLVRETLYDGLTAGRRARLHQRIGEILEERYGAGAGGHIAELAHHFFESQVAGAERAVAYAQRAGDEAVASLAYEEAARFYRMALAAFEAAHEAPDVATRIELLVALGDANARAGDLAAGREAFLDAAAAARRAGLPRQLARAALGYGGRFIWTRAGNDPHMVPLLQDALVLLGGEDDRLRVRLLARLACAWRDSAERREQSDALSQQAVDMARALDDPPTLSYALVGRFGAVWWPDNAAERLEIARELLAVAETHDDAERIVDAHLSLLMTYAELAMMREARFHHESVRRLAHELRQPAQLWLVWAFTAVFALMEGDYDRAEAAILSEIQPGRPISVLRDDVSSSRMHRFLLRREQARLGEIEPEVRDSVVAFPWYPLHRSALVCLLLDLGRHDEARSEFRELAHGQFAMFYHDNEWLLGVALAAEACSRLEESEHAAELYRQLAPFSGRHAIGLGEGSVGALDRYLGLLAMLLGRLDDAERHFEDAVALNTRMGSPAWTAWTRLDLAEMLERRGGSSDAERGQEHRVSAATTAREIGMTALLTRLRDGAAAGVTDAASVASTDRAGAAAGGALFRREGEYWTVAMDGQSASVRDSKGMRYLSELLRRPGTEMLALDLAREADGAGPAASGGDTAELRREAMGNAGAILDAEAKAAYRARLEELRAEEAEAERYNDPERVALAKREIEALAAELAGAVGLGGRDRHAASSTERARLSVTRAIRSALDRLQAAHPAVGRHLAATIRTGTYCSYVPDPRAPVAWQT